VEVCRRDAALKQVGLDVEVNERRSDRVTRVGALVGERLLNLVEVAVAAERGGSRRRNLASQLAASASLAAPGSPS
jgi:hypothetical protein